MQMAGDEAALAARIAELERELARVTRLKESLKEGYRTSFELAGVGIAHVSTGGAFLDVNARFCEMLGRSKPELLSLAFRDITYSEDVQPNSELFGQLMRGDIPGYHMDKRYVRANGEVFWAELTVAAHRDEHGAPIKLISIINDITDRKQSEERLTFLMGEVAHRTKNMLAVVQAIIHQSAAGETSVEALKSTLSRRIAGMAASQASLVLEEGEAATMADLVMRQLSVFLSDDDARVRLLGPHLILNAPAARALGMALHELATNAIKHGSLSVSGSTVDVEWSIDEADAPQFRIAWRERGGPPVAAPSRRGFGRRVIEQMVALSTGGKVTLDFAPDGVSWSLECPLANITASTNPV